MEEDYRAYRASRDREICETYEAMKKSGMKPKHAREQLGEMYFLSESSILKACYNKQRKGEIDFILDGK